MTTRRSPCSSTCLPSSAQLVAAHVIDDRPYDELAGELDTSEAVVRQRVSRGLATLRRLKGTRR